MRLVPLDDSQGRVDNELYVHGIDVSAVIDIDSGIAHVKAQGRIDYQLNVHGVHTAVIVHVGGIGRRQFHARLEMDPDEELRELCRGLDFQDLVQPILKNRAGTEVGLVRRPAGCPF